MQIIDEWFRDIPQQFLGKRNIEVLIKAFARQLQELQQVFDDMNTKLDLDVATGQNLDYVGTIVPLTRKEAGELAGIDVADPVISDERYRQFLKYKVLKNTSECTYYDLIAGIRYLWDIGNVHYIEDPDYPATIIFQTPELDADALDLTEFHTNLCIRASGVGLMLRKIYQSSVNADIAVEMSRLCIQVQVFLNNAYLYLDGTWYLDGNYNVSGAIPDQVEIQMEMIEENYLDATVDGTVTVDKLWYLDGEYFLDGEKTLDADIRKFMLDETIGG